MFEQSYQLMASLFPFITETNSYHDKGTLVGSLIGNLFLSSVHKRPLDGVLYIDNPLVNLARSGMGLLGR